MVECVSSCVNYDPASLQPETSSQLPVAAPKIPSENDPQEKSHSNSTTTSKVDSELKLPLLEVSKTDEINKTECVNSGETKNLSESDVKSNDTDTTDCPESDVVKRSHSNTNIETEIVENSQVADVSVFTQVSSHCSDMSKEVENAVVEPAAAAAALSNGISTEM